jgi:hypothetical protein
MRRCEFIVGLVGAAAWPLLVRAQPEERMRRIGVLIQLAENSPDVRAHVAAFRNELGRLGWEWPQQPNHLSLRRQRLGSAAGLGAPSTVPCCVVPSTWINPN